MCTPKLSVIIPVYNVELYLARCVESVFIQSLTDIEIILVDDGSQDSCSMLCDAYARKDPRVRVIHQTNVGLAGARNSGLRVAKGNYVAFLDSDDWIEPDAYEKLYAKARAYDADIVFCQAKYFDDSDQKIIEAEDNSSLPLFRDTRFAGAFTWRDIGADKIFSYDSFVVAWNKICRREFLATLQADFPVGLIYEDNPFYFQTIFAAKRLAVVRERLACYRIKRKGSIIADVTEGKNAKAIHVMAIMANIEARLRVLLPEKDYRMHFNAYAYNEFMYKFSLVPEVLHTKYMALAKGILPFALYLKLWLFVLLKRFKSKPLSYRSFIQYVKEPNRRKVELLCNIPLITVEKKDKHPGQFDTIIAFGESSDIARDLAEHYPGNRFAMYSRLNSCDFAEYYSALVARTGTGLYPVYCNRPDIPQGTIPPHDDVKSLPEIHMQSIRNLFAISESTLLLDFAENSLSAENLKVLFYNLNCFYHDKEIRYLRLHRDKRIHRVLKGMEMKNFHRFFVVALLGFTVLVARRR
jgi:glycosyltransferase involved in cell wall biosynthesis